MAGKKIILGAIKVCVSLFLIVLALRAGEFFARIHRFDRTFRSTYPHVYSSSGIRSDIESLSRRPFPADAINVFFARSGGMSQNKWMALTLADEIRCEAFVKDRFKISFGQFSKETQLSKDSASYLVSKLLMPVRWPKRDKAGWDITRYKEFFVYEYRKYGSYIIAYVPEHSRVFIYYRDPS